LPVGRVLVIVDMDVVYFSLTNGKGSPLGLQFFGKETRGFDIAVVLKELEDKSMDEILFAHLGDELRCA
jgi:hypothetical protein